MRRILFFILVIIMMKSHAQWADNGSSLTTSDNVGIGTTNPIAKLQVNGDFYLYSNDAYESGWGKTHFYWNRHSLIMGTPKGRYAHNRIELKPGGSNTGELISSLEMYQAIGIDNYDKRIRLSTSNFHPTWFDGGNVGIGTRAPGSWKLAVNGKIRAKEIKVETSWSDFVFEDNYTLPTLEEVEQHILEKGHLQNIPSAKEVEENGVYLGEMDAKLLQKIEELTLYTIEQQKEIELLKKENKAQREEIEKLKTK
ncbi:hypothetical protein OOZ15_05285 [Galbibacter sp. EGI 63066]|uniref:hypothetical protein n=1 Tax=Galbibacter sp. EGI 63066 TaxID=2993559 RepID=UPI0022490B91|nr:hypothetical protein [Galbibacter sp. EGI 63066]MCX2679349.1 hypothetical protein [Galbibacter sp. EGI 63066]